MDDVSRIGQAFPLFAKHQNHRKPVREDIRPRNSLDNIIR